MRGANAWQYIFVWYMVALVAIVLLVWINL